MQSEPPTLLVPHYLIASKPHVTPALVTISNEDGTQIPAPTSEQIPSGVILREDRMPGKPGSTTTASYAKYQELRIMHDLKETVCEVLPRTWDEE